MLLISKVILAMSIWIFGIKVKEEPTLPPPPIWFNLKLTVMKRWKPNHPIGRFAPHGTDDMPDKCYSCIFWWATTILPANLAKIPSQYIPGMCCGIFPCGMSVSAQTHTRAQLIVVSLMESLASLWWLFSQPMEPTFPLKICRACVGKLR